MNWILFYCILMPIAWLPLWVLYRLSDLAYLVVYYVARYRRNVTRTNLQKSFPEKNDREITILEKKYYRHLCDLLVEALYGLRATPLQVLKHYKVVNREVINKYYEKGQSVILMSSHYNNWEYMVLSINFQLRHHGIGVGKPLSNKSFGRYLTRKRTRYGDEIVDQTNVRQVMAFYDLYKVPCAYMMLSDQSPSNPRKCFWTEFLHQDTGFLYGSEHFARKYNYPVLYYEVKKVKRGYYEIEIQELCENPMQMPEGGITLSYTLKLEELIRRQPEYWLWTHKRWKKKRPEELMHND